MSHDPKVCINCHVMNTQYATWEHSAHAKADVGCLDCHANNTSMFAQLKDKARDGWNHTIAFSFDSYENAIQMSENSQQRVQQNCVTCHANIASTLNQNHDKNHGYNEKDLVVGGRKCWECHKSTPHGKVRGLSTTPHNLGVKKVME